MLVVLILYILNAVHICTKSTDIMFPYTAKILQYTENSKHIFPEMKLLNSYIHVSVSDLYIPTIGLPILLQENRWTDPGNIQIAHGNWD